MVVAYNHPSPDLGLRVRIRLHGGETGVPGTWPLFGVA
jgi:hypothetical protein